MFDAVWFYFPRIAFRRYAKLALREFAPDRAARIWSETLEQQKSLALRRPRYSLGTNFLLRYMEWDCALYRAIRAEGIAEDRARAVIEKINWDAFGPMIRLSFQCSRLRSSHLLTRVMWILDAMFAFIFTSPFQRKKYAHLDEIAFDVTSCPLAKYFKDQGAPELTNAAACRLDYQMASVWSMELVRAQTIAEGHSFCDFRFRARLAGQSAVVKSDLPKQSQHLDAS